MTEMEWNVEDALKSLLEQKKYQALKDILVTMNPADIATVFEEINDEKIPRFFRLLPKGMAAETFVEMEPEMQEAAHPRLFG